MSFFQKVRYNKLWQNLPTGVRLPLVRRRDFHEDGSVSTTYYLELTEDLYHLFGGPVDDQDSHDVKSETSKGQYEGDDKKVADQVIEQVFGEDGADQEGRTAGGEVQP